MINENNSKSPMGVKQTALISNSIIHIVLVILSIIWIIPIVWVIMTSFRGESGSFTAYLIPHKWTLQNYNHLLFGHDVYNFRQWFVNTLFVALCSGILSTMLNLSTAYVMSRLRFKLRKPIMNVALVLGFFPGFMSMIAVYYVLKAVGLTQTLSALIIVYSSGAALGFYIAKGFFDTVPASLDEAARIDGATNAVIFTKIILPLSQPVMVYTALTAFMAPWVDFIFARVIIGDNSSKFTVAIGLFNMIDKEHIDKYFTQFSAGCVLIAIPITIMFVWLQRFFVDGVTGGAVKG